MIRAARSLAVAGILTASACLAGRESNALSIDPTARGFELPNRPVILFYVDGLRADVLEELAAAGELTRLRERLFDRAVRVRSAVTSVPSVTYANAVSMLTGAWPSTHGVWANASFDRDRLLTRNYEVQRERAVGDDSCTTIFE